MNNATISLRLPKEMAALVARSGGSEYVRALIAQDLAKRSEVALGSGDLSEAMALRDFERIHDGQSYTVRK